MLTLPEMLGDVRSAFSQDPADWEESITTAIRNEAIHHVSRNGFYRAQCEAVGFDPSSIHQIGDLRNLPLLPVGMFKRPDAHVLLSCSLEDIETEIRSTGTSGVPSVARRDATTVTRALIGLSATYRDFFALSKGAGLFLSPSTAEAPEMGMVKVFNILNGAFDHHAYLVEDYAFEPEEAVAYLARWEGKMTRHIIGPPFLIGRFLRYLELEEIPIALDPDSMVITLGGWKRYTGESISPVDFREKCQKFLGIASRNVRDMYGMIESNMLALECEYHNKHVPPWAYVSVRDVEDTNSEVRSGETGIIAVLDALNTSYPGFILSDDVGEVEFGTCKCGRTGQMVAFRRRRQGAELGCCAVSIERYLDDGAISLACEVPSTKEGVTNE